MNARRDVSEFGLRRWIIVLGVVLAPLLETIDSSIVNVALPTLQGNLGATLDQAAWVITGYLVANVIVIPITPWLQDRFGRRQYFTVTVIGFTIVSALCGCVDSITLLIVLRVVQGLFGGGLIATSQAALRDIFPPQEVGTSQAIFAVVILIGPILAPMLGGYLIDVASWQWIFFINIVPGTISAIIIGTMLRNPTDPESQPVDVAGLGLLAVALGSLQFFLEEGERRDWFDSPSIDVALAASIAAAIGFVVWELRGTRKPIVDLHVLRYRGVYVAVLLAMGIATTLFGTTLIMPIFTQNVLGFTAYDSGLLLLYRALPVMLLTPAVAGLVASGRVDSRIAMATGYLLSGIGSLVLALAFTSNTPFGAMVPGLLIGGLGTAMLLIPLLITVQTSTPVEDAAQAGSFVTLAFQLGGSIASAAIVTALDRRTDFHSDVLAGSITLAHPAIRSALTITQPAQLAQIVSQQATTLAFADIGYGVAAIAVLLIPFVLLLRRQTVVEGGLILE